MRRLCWKSMERCEKVSTSVGACSWLRCDWSIYILGCGFSKVEFLHGVPWREFKCLLTRPDPPKNSQSVIHPLIWTSLDRECFLIATSSPTPKNQLWINGNHKWQHVCRFELGVISFRSRLEVVFICETNFIWGKPRIQ